MYAEGVVCTFRFFIFVLESLRKKAFETTLDTNFFKPHNVMKKALKQEYLAPLAEELGIPPYEICTTSPESYGDLGNDSWDIVDFKW